MQSNLSNQIIASREDEMRNSPRRTLDLENIFTPELGLLSPQRIEIAPRGGGRDAALIAYSERLRNSYKTNEGGIRDGMMKLGEAFRDGQTIAVSCFCRAGEICHADVVKMAIEKVGNSLLRESRQLKPQAAVEQRTNDLKSNPRTERAINEILSVGRSDMILSKLEDTEGRNRSEHASHLNGYSQFARDLYERGAVVRDGVLITLKENPSLTPPLAVATAEYAVKRLTRILSETQAKELAPQIVDYGTRIAGSSADRDTTIKVFNWIYGALEGRSDLLPSDDKVLTSETKEERFDRTLNEIAGLAEEMTRLEPSDNLVPVEQLSERDEFDTERGNNDLSLDKIYDDAIIRSDTLNLQDPEAEVNGITEFERVELGDTAFARLTADMSKEELDRWTNVRLPVLDDLLESGMPVDVILKPFQNDIYHAAKMDPAGKQSAIDDLRFASSYIEYQLKQPESRLRHFNARYRNYATMLERASSRDEVMDSASRIRLENAKLGFQWEKLSEAERAGTERALTSKEMQFLFTEASPHHYTSTMTAIRLAYSNSGDAARAKTESFLRGEITPSPEAMKLIESLESRLERRRATDSLSATRHFLQSLKTSNDELRYKNAFDHSEFYRKLPPAERDFVYQRAVLQKERLEATIFEVQPPLRTSKVDAVQERSGAVEIGQSLREDLKTELLEFFKANPTKTVQDLKERTTSIVEKQLEGLGTKVDKESVSNLSREFGERPLIKELNETRLMDRTVNSNVRSSDQRDLGALVGRQLHER